MSVDYAIANTANRFIQGGLEVYTNTNGGEVTVTAKLYFRRTGGYDTPTYDYNVSRWITIDGSTASETGYVGINTGQMNGWQGPVLTASKTFTGAARGITISWGSDGASSTHFDGSGSAWFTVPSGYVAPSGGYIDILDYTHDSVTARVGVGSFGVPNTACDLELKILNEPYVAGKAARQNSYLANGATTTVSNNSASYNGEVIISGNKRYYTGLYAYNGALAYRYQGPSFITPPPPLTKLEFNSQKYHTYNTVSATFNWVRAADGDVNGRTIYYRYSVDEGSTFTRWEPVGPANTMAGSFTILGVPTGKTVIFQALVHNGQGSIMRQTSFNSLATHTAPNFSNFEYYDNNPATVALTENDQVFIQGQSSPVVKITPADKATGNQSVGVGSYNIAFSGSNYLLGYSNTDVALKELLAPSAPSSEGKLTLTVSAVDNLSLSQSVSKDIIVYPWAEPTTTASISRENGFEEDSTLTIKGTYSSLIIGDIEKNTIAVKCRFKKSSTSTWDDEWENLSVTIDGGNWTASNLSKKLDNNSQWDVQICVVDKFSETYTNLSLAMGIPKFFVGADGRVAVGQRPNIYLPDGKNGQLEVAGHIYAAGECYSGGATNEKRLARMEDLPAIKTNTSNPGYCQIGPLLIQWGSKTVQMPAAANAEDRPFDIAFPEEFTQEPTVMITPGDMNDICGEFVVMDNATTKGFRGIVGHTLWTDSKSITVHWTAIGFGQSLSQ